jgi:predicted DNA-binding transcriptional regulator YafY
MSDDAFFKKVTPDVKRLFDVIAAIGRHPGLGPEGIAQVLGTGAESTVRKDIKRLKMLGLLPVQSMRKGYYLSDFVVNHEERQAMMSGLRLLGQDLMDESARRLFDDLAKRWAASASDEVAWRYPVDAIGHRLTMDLTSPERCELIASLRRAIVGRYPVLLEELRDPYQPLLGPDTYQVWVLQLIFHDVGWYALLERVDQRPHDGRESFFVQRLDRLKAPVPQAGEARDFNRHKERMQRARNLLALGWDMFVPTSFDETHRFTARLKCGTVASALLSELEHLPESASQRTGQKGYAQIQVTAWNGGASAAVTLPKDEQVVNEFVRWLSTWAHEIEVIEPAWLRERMIERLTKTVLAYGVEAVDAVRAASRGTMSSSDDLNAGSVEIEGQYLGDPPLHRCDA